jgi:hypothetical protein
MPLTTKYILIGQKNTKSNKIKKKLNSYILFPVLLKMETPLLSYILEDASIDAKMKVISSQNPAIQKLSFF